MSEPLFSLVSGEGDGAMLGIAAGDAAGGAWELGYSAVTEQATVLAYELIANGQLDRQRVIDVFMEMDGSKDEQPVFRAESPEFRAWLDSIGHGSRPDKRPSLDPLGRSAILGVSYRRQPEKLYREVIDLNTLFHTDAESILAGVILSSAVAASCFGQAGRDLIKGVAEAVGPAVEELGDPSSGLSETGRVGDADRRVQKLIDGYGIKAADEALRWVTDSATPGPVDIALAALLVGAPAAEKAHEPVAEAARIGGSNGGAAIGAMIGARLGIRAWPWAFANDTWFAEIGRRLVRGPHEIIDLPIPYAVEQHLISGISGTEAEADDR